MSYHEYQFYATGRNNIQFALMNINLQRRQDLFTMFFLNFFFAEKDRVTIEVPIDIPDQVSLPIEMMIIQKKDSKVAMSNMPHLKKFIKTVEIKNLSSEVSLCAMAETSEVAN
jgi:hypothetical protein